MQVKPLSTLDPAPRGAHEEAHSGLITALEDYVPQVAGVTGTPGISVALATDGGLTWEAGFGFADLSRRIPMSARTTARVGSFSKIYVGTAVMQLVEEGVIDLYGAAQEYLPDLRLQNPFGEREITIYDLLTYRSGLGTDTGEYSFERTEPLAEYLRKAFEEATRPEYRHGLARWTAKVGERYQYSSFGMATLGYLVERANPDGQSFSEYTLRNIIEPLDLESTAFPVSNGPSSVRSHLLARLAQGYSRFGETYLPTPFLHSPLSPAVGLITTPEDQTRLLMSYLQALREPGHLVEPATARQMISPQVRISEFVGDSDEWNGLGFEMANVAQEAFYFGHGGAVPYGWYSYCAAFPKQGLVIVVCTNKWDMTRFFNPMPEIASGRIIDFVSQWVARRAAGGPTVVSKAWEWKSAYVMGLMMVERTRGLLGARGCVAAETINEMSQAACLPHARPASWDSDAFRAGVAHMLEVEATPTSIRDFLETNPYVCPEELRLFGLAFGKRPDLRAPLPFFAKEAASRPG